MRVSHIRLPDGRIVTDDSVEYGQWVARLHREPECVVGRTSHPRNMGDDLNWADPCPAEAIVRVGQSQVPYCLDHGIATLQQLKKDHDL